MLRTPSILCSRRYGINTERRQLHNEKYNMHFSGSIYSATKGFKRKETVDLGHT